MIRNILPTGFDSDERGVSEIIGAIFVFAIVIMLLAIVQVWAVPAANEQTEFEHNQRALADLQSLGADVDRTAGLGTTGSSPVELGPQYSTRLFLINPPTPVGSLETEPGTIRISNVRAVNTETDDHVNGALQFDTRSLRYRPNYNEYDGAPTTHYEGWTLYNEFEETNIVYDGRKPVSGTTISLVALDGTQSTATRGTVDVPTRPISAPSKSVSVRNRNNGPVNITLVSGLSATEWSEEILADEIANGHVIGVEDVSENEIKIMLDGNQTYDLRLAKVGIGSRTTDEGAHYLTTTEPRPALDSTGGTVTVEVRDRFNNPVPGVDVSFSAVDEIGLEGTVTSDENGKATARFTDPTVNATTITASANVNDEPEDTADDRGTVTFTNVPVRYDGTIDDSDSEINPDDESSLKFVSSRLDVGTGPNPNYVFVKLENQGPDRTVREVRINAYLSNTFSQAGVEVPDFAIIDGGGPPRGQQYEVGGPYQEPTGSFERSIESGDDVTYRFEFRLGGENWDTPNRADFMVFSIRFTDGTTSRYFIQMDVR